MTLGGVQMNLSGIIGPAIGAVLLPVAGASALFALIAVGFLIVIIAIEQVQQEATPSRLS